MKILFTGMASSHSKPSSNVNFFKLFASSLEGKADIEWAVPSLTWDKDYLNQYDLIFVGIVPPTSPSANKLYGAMHVINIMFDSPKLNLIVDHPQLWQFKSGFNSIYKNISGVFTPFYSKRKEFSLAKESVYSASISAAAEKLLTLKWPRTIYPKLPWQNDLDILSSLGANLDTEIVGINLDSNLLVDKPEITYNRSGWAVDAPNTKWSYSMNTRTPHSPRFVCSLRYLEVAIRLWRWAIRVKLFIHGAVHRPGQLAHLTNTFQRRPVSEAPLNIHFLQHLEMTNLYLNLQTLYLKKLEQHRGSKLIH
jgi:hypothetical protein